MKTSTKLPLERHILNGATMGTRYSAVFYAAPALDLAPIARDLFEAVDRVDQQMSTWKPQSDLNRLNAAPVDMWIDIPPELGRVLAEGQRISHLTGGAFDMGVGDLIASNGFGASPGVPDPVAQAARQGKARLFASTMLEFSPDRRRARRTGPVSLDLSGIAKGFGVDELGRVLDQHGITDWLVSLDGELRANGTKPDSENWAVALEKPEIGARSALSVLELSDTAIATSGNYRHLRREGGKMVSHTMDPRTGEPVQNGLASVSVLAKTCMEADAFATAFFVMGEDAGPKMAQVLGFEAIFITQNGDVLSNLGQ